MFLMVRDGCAHNELALRGAAGLYTILGVGLDFSLLDPRRNYLYRMQRHKQGQATPKYSDSGVNRFFVGGSQAPPQHHMFLMIRDGCAHNELGFHFSLLPIKPKYK